jgi:hypothetical protein
MRVKLGVKGEVTQKAVALCKLANQVSVLGAELTHQKRCVPSAKIYLPACGVQPSSFAAFGTWYEKFWQ